MSRASVFANELSKNYRLEIKPQKSFIQSPIYTKKKSFRGEDLLLFQIIEKQEHGNNQSRTKFYVLNPAEKIRDLTQIFEGFCQEHPFFFLSPLFNGWGVVKDNNNELFWFCAITGEKGPVISKGTYQEFIFKENLIFFTNEGLNRYNLKSGEFLYIPIRKSKRSRFFSPNKIIKENLIFLLDDGLYRYNLKSGQLFHISITFKNYDLISPYKIVAEINDKNQTSMIGLDILTFKVKKLAKIPQILNTSVFPHRRIGMAGKDGVFLVHGLSLWFKPNNKNWRNVAKDVPIFRIYGATRPYLPVAYLGNGKFAIAKSIKKEVTSIKKNDKDPKALSLTMLVDGYTGKIIEESEPILHEYDPPLNIPDHWLTEKQKKLRDKYTNSKRIFNGSIQHDEVKTIELAEKDIIAYSASNKYIAIYRKWSSDWGDNAKYLNFKIIEKQTGKTRNFKINTNKKELYVSGCHWLMMTGSEFDTEKLNKYQSNQFEPWHGYSAWWAHLGQQ